MAHDTQSSGSGPPLVHPRAVGLEAVVRDTVKEEIARQGGGNGGGGELEKRVTAIERQLAVIENTMVTTEGLQKELGAIKTELSKVPFETIKWFFAVAGIIAAIVFGVYNVLLKH